MLGPMGITNIFVAAALLPEALGYSLRHLKTMEYQAIMSAPPAYCAIENGFDYVGNDISNAPGAVETCCQQCLSVSGCKAWSWSNHQGGTCWFKSGRGEIAVNPNVKSALFFFGTRPSCQLMTDVDYPGNDLACVDSAKPEGCCDICQKTLGCRAYSWSEYQGGSCWLKTKAGQATVKAGVKSAEAYPDINDACMPTESGVDYVGFDIGNKPSATATGCCTECKTVPGCRAFSWTNQSGGTCWLKSIAGERIYEEGVTSASVVMNPEPPCKIEIDVDYVGNEMASVHSYTHKNCCYICMGRAGCKAWSWSDYEGGTCWLKTGKGAAIKKVGVMSATV